MPVAHADGLERIQIGDRVHIMLWAYTPVVVDGIIHIERQVVGRLTIPVEHYEQLRAEAALDTLPKSQPEMVM